MEHNYCEHHKVLGKELEEYMDCFSDSPNIETLCIVEKLAKTMVKLYELEAYEIMFDCLEDCFGYDRDEHEFEDKDNGGTDYVLYAIMNRYDPMRMTSGTSRYPTTTRGGQSYGRDYGTGADHRYGERYNERSTDKSMYQPYGMDYGYGMGGWMNMADGDRNRMMDDRRNGERNGERNGDRNGNRDRDMDSRSGERDMERSRNTNRIYNMAADHDMKKSLKALTPKEMEKWVKDLESDDGKMGEVFSKSEIESIARKHNINFEDEGYDLDTLWLMANVMYSDYASVISKMPNGNQPINYVKLAMAFLDDPDVDLEPEMKVAKYYRSIVEDKDD